MARYETIKAFLACSVEEEMHVHQIDVETAYLQGTLDDEIYMTQSEMFIDTGKNQPGKVYKLNRPLYGLKQAGSQWYKEIDRYLTTMNFEKSAGSPCVYTSKNSDVIIVLYDLLIGSKDLDRIVRTKKELKSKFKMKDLGQVRDILGMRIDRDGQTGSIRLSQKKYIEELLEKFNMKDCKSMATPMEVNERFVSEPKSKEHKPHRELIGSLIYLANATRPDIAFATNALSRFYENPKIAH